MREKVKTLKEQALTVLREGEKKGFAAQILGRELRVPGSLVWAAGVLDLHSSRPTPIGVFLGRWLPRPPWSGGEEVSTGDPLEDRRWKRRQAASEGLLRWAEGLASRLGVLFEGDTLGELEGVAQKLEALLEEEHLPEGAPLQVVGWYLQSRPEVRALAERLGWARRDITPLLHTLVGAGAAADPRAWLSDRAARGGKLAARLLELWGPEAGRAVEVSQRAWALAQARGFIKVVQRALGEEIEEGEEVRGVGEENPLRVDEPTLIREALLEREGGSRGENLEAFLTFLVRRVTGEGEADWIDPAEAYVLARKAFFDALRARSNLRALRPTAAAALAVRIYGERARAGMFVERPLEEDELRALNLLWGLGLLAKARNEGRLLRLEEALEGMRAYLRAKGEDPSFLEGERVQGVLEEYLLKIQNLVHALENPVEGTEGLTFGDVLPAPDGKEEEQEEREDVREALRLLVEALQKEGHSKEAARAMTGALWARHGLGIPEELLRDWVGKQEGMASTAIPRDRQALRELLQEMEERFALYYLSVVQGWRVV